MITAIITHPGGAHKDDMLACSIMIARYRVPVYRREPTPEDLADPQICVIDVGGEHNPAKMNFDHHQFPREHEPACALTLVLQYLGLYDDALLFCDWLKTVEWMDTRGPVETAKWLNVDREAMSMLNSPIDMTTIRRFAQHSVCSKGDVIWELMAMLGEDMIHFVTSMRKKLNYLEAHVVFWKINEETGAEAAFLANDEKTLDDVSSGMIRFLNMHKKTNVVALIYPDRRGSGYGLSRFNDSKLMEYTRIADEADVHFAHNRGFVAKTGATDEARLLELVKASYLAPGS